MFSSHGGNILCMEYMLAGWLCCLVGCAVWLAVLSGWLCWLAVWLAGWLCLLCEHHILKGKAIPVQAQRVPGGSGSHVS